MRLIIALLITFLFLVSSYGQNNDPEYWRAQGYQAKVDGDYQTATDNYLKVLTFD